jgi:hypothetical protein
MIRSSAQDFWSALNEQLGARRMELVPTRNLEQGAIMFSADNLPLIYVEQSFYDRLVAEHGFKPRFKGQ